MNPSKNLSNAILCVLGLVFGTACAADPGDPIKVEVPVGEMCLVNAGCTNVAACSAVGFRSAPACVTVSTMAGELLALYDCPVAPACEASEGLVLTGTK